jgi:hypothetical protein
MTPEQREKWLAGRTTHGAYSGGRESAEHAVWRTMIARCMNPKRKEYHSYGGRGITVCARWLASYENFIADMGPRPPPTHSLEREDNDAGYGPSNCKWATPFEQASNKRNSVRWTFAGVTRIASEWARALGISKELANWRGKTWGGLTKEPGWQLQNQR